MRLSDEIVGGDLVLEGEVEVEGGADGGEGEEEEEEEESSSAGDEEEEEERVARRGGGKGVRGRRNGVDV